MTELAREPLLPSAVEVPFTEIGATLERLAGGKNCAPARAQIATVVVIGSRPELREAAAALEQLTGSGGVRVILLSAGENPSPSALVAAQAVALEGLVPKYLNNAVAALRLSSLPTVVWWRGEDPALLDGFAALADRLVLDDQDPGHVWHHALELVEQTALTDLRWTRLTRWRALMANFFDIPAVRAAAPGFTRLEIKAADRYTARLFAAWLSSSLRWKGRVTIQSASVQGGAPLAAVRFGDDSQELALEVAPGGTCVVTSLRVAGHPAAKRTASLGDSGLSALIAEELRVRSRDLAFERALAAVEGVS
jgi:glucose-6-phosphate dehydrogenase assembly protein OpcA